MTLAVWTVTFDVISDSGTLVSTNESLLFVASSAGDAICQALTYGADTINGAHWSVSGATIRLNDPLNNDIPSTDIYASRVGLADLNA
jgi:hypothetical protein